MHFSSSDTWVCALFYQMLYQILFSSYKKRCWFCSHFTDEETKSWRGETLCPAYQLVAGREPWSPFARESYLLETQLYFERLQVRAAALSPLCIDISFLFVLLPQ